MMSLLESTLAIVAWLCIGTMAIVLPISIVLYVRALYLFWQNEILEDRDRTSRGQAIFVPKIGS